MNRPRLAKVLLAIPLVLVDTGLCLLAGFLMVEAFVGGAMTLPAPWWIAPVSAISALTLIAGLIFVGSGAIQHLHDLRDPGRVLTRSLQGLGVNLLGAVLGVLLIPVFLLSGAVLAATH